MRFLGENISFFWFGSGRAKGRGREKFKTSFDDPRGSVGRNLSNQKLKLISSMRSTRVYKKK